MAAEKTALMLADTCRCLLVLIALLLTRGVCLGSVDEVNEQKKAHSHTHRLTDHSNTVQKQAPDHFIELSPIAIPSDPPAGLVEIRIH